MTEYTIDDVVFQPHSKDPRFQDLTGMVFNRLTVLGYAGDRTWWCECICGSFMKAKASNLKNSNTKSCGCYSFESVKSRSTMHGATAGRKLSSEFVAYCRAMQRCRDLNDKDYPNYGGRGILFLFSSYEEFIACIGFKASKDLSLDRIDPEGHYEIGNVRWATQKQQQRNRRNNVNVEYDGRTQCLAAWAEEFGLNVTTFSDRLKRGWPIEKALKTQPRKMR
jgi:hypothetical protein